MAVRPDYQPDPPGTPVRPDRPAQRRLPDRPVRLLLRRLAAPGSAEVKPGAERPEHPRLPGPDRRLHDAERKAHRQGHADRGPPADGEGQEAGGMRRHDRKRVPNWIVGLVLIVVIAVASLLAYTKTLPWSHQYTIKAVFSTAQTVAPNSPVRIAGVNVGKVTSVESLVA